jgi:SpoVK/Ycf46/Vps4 family AAA+-type ATPase
MVMGPYETWPESRRQNQANNGDLACENPPHQQPEVNVTAQLNTLGADIELPKGIQRILKLPNDDLGGLWSSIFLDKAIKEKLLAQAALNFSMRGKVSRNVIPLHGVILLVGPPGTGKTSLARGLAHRVAKAFPQEKFRLLEVEPHQLASSSLGRSQRAVTELFSQAIAEAAAAGSVVVLLDEVETLAADRNKLSMDANPVDVHRATDAVLVQLDQLAEQYPQLLFVATSNFPRAVDAAFTSRCDLVLEIPLPSKEACADILKDCLAGLGVTYSAIGKLIDKPGFVECAAACIGLDGRAIRKLVASAIATDIETALHPEKVTLVQILAAAKSAKAARAAAER